MSGIVTSPLGRRRAMQMVNIPFFIAWLILHFSTTTGHLYGALFITGLAGGLLEAPVSYFMFIRRRWELQYNQQQVQQVAFCDELNVNNIQFLNRLSLLLHFKNMLK